MRYYVDWGNKKKFAVLDNDSDKPKMMVFNSFLELLEKGDEVYIETGCPFSKICKLMSAKVKIFIIDSQSLKLLRPEYVASITADNREVDDDKKSDLNDARLVRFAVQNNKVELKEVPLVYLDYKEKSVIAKLYQLFTDNLTQAKNMKSSFLREYPNKKKFKLLSKQLDDCMKPIEDAKKKMAKNLESEFGEHVKKLGIKGISHCLLGQILNEAPPMFYHCLTAYLKNAKLKRIEDHKYNRNLRALYYLATQEVIMHKSEPYRSMYEKFKNERGYYYEKVKGKKGDKGDWVERINTPESKEFLAKYEVKKSLFESDPKNKDRHFCTYRSHVEGATQNRIATFIAKKVYATFKS